MRAGLSAHIVNRLSRERPTPAMSTIFDPSKEAPSHLVASPASLNGKAVAPPSQAAARADFWRKTAPKRLRNEQLAADEALSLYWSKRARRAAIGELCPAEDTPLRWGAIAGGTSPATQKLVDLAAQLSSAKGVRKASTGKAKQEAQGVLTHWLDEAKNAPASYDLALGCLAAAHVVAAMGGSLSPLAGWKVLDFLADTARHAATWNLGADAVAEHVVAAQMLGGELPLTLAYLFSEMAPLEKAAAPAMALISESIVELLNGQGLMRAAHLSALRPLLACWTRCVAIAGEMKRVNLSKKARREFERLVRQSLRWTAPDSSPLLAGEGAEPWPVDFLQATLRLGGTAKDAAAARVLLGKKAVGKLAADTKSAEGPYNCEWASLAVMRTGWSTGDAVVAVDYSTPQLRLDVWAGKRRLFGGAVTAETQVDGKPLKANGSWEEVCWFKDKDVDYLELALPLQGGTRLERQILLARRDGFLLIADHVQGAKSAGLEHALQLPLGPGLLFCGEGETRDALLVDGEPRARLMPLALPEWRIDPRVGELSYTGGYVRLVERAAAKTLACPLFVDLRPERAARQSTWRQLTVAEGLQIQPADVAVSYRVQSGDDQWVYYRSQGPRGNRTFMGQNTSSECVVARFKAPSGKVDSLLEIEG